MLQLVCRIIFVVLLVTKTITGASQHGVIKRKVRLHHRTLTQVSDSVPTSCQNAAGSPASALQHVLWRSLLTSSSNSLTSNTTASDSPGLVVSLDDFKCLYTTAPDKGGLDQPFYTASHKHVRIVASKPDVGYTTQVDMGFMAGSIVLDRGRPYGLSESESVVQGFQACSPIAHASIHAQLCMLA